MTETANTFRCDVCGRRHPWSPALAGQTITCQCLEPVAVPPQPDDGQYDLAPVPVEPIKEPTVRHAAAYEQSSTLSYQRPLEPGIGEVYSEANPLIVSVRKDLVIPITLILFGTIMTFLWAYRTDPAFATGGASKAHAALAVSGTFTYDLVVTLVGIIAAARLLGVSFGPVPTAILKLGAIAIGPAGLRALLIWSLGGSPYALAAGWVLGIGVYFSLFWYLFELDTEELWNTVGIVYIARTLFSIAWFIVVR